MAFLVAVVTRAIFLLGWLVTTALGGRSTLLSKGRSLGNHRDVAHSTQFRILVKHPKYVLACDRIVVIAFGEVFLKALLKVSMLFATIQEEYLGEETFLSELNDGFLFGGGEFIELAFAGRGMDRCIICNGILKHVGLVEDHPDCHSDINLRIELLVPLAGH